MQNAECIMQNDFFGNEPHSALSILHFAFYFTLSPSAGKLV